VKLHERDCLVGCCWGKVLSNNNNKLEASFCERRVICVPYVWWRHETVMVRGKGQVRFRELKSGRFIKKP